MRRAVTLCCLLCVGCASPKTDASKASVNSEAPREVAPAKPNARASSEAQAAYIAMLQAPTADALAPTLTCFDGGAKVSAAAAMAAMNQEEASLRSMSVEVLLATEERVSLVDRGLHTSPERAQLYERAVVMRRVEGAWKVEALHSLGAVACEGPEFKSAKAPAPFVACAAKDTCAKTCEAACAGPTGSNGGMTCVETCGQALTACLKL